VSHWYNKEGDPCYEVTGKKGKRPSTLRDARKYSWVPSVSTVWGDIVSRHMLNKWIQTELMKAFHEQMKLRADSTGILSFDDIEKLARSEFNKKQQKVMGRGTDIHDHLEKYFKGEEVPEEFQPLCKGVDAKLNEVCGPQEWEVEQSFSHPLGYGGRTDLSNDEWIVDFKTKEFPDNPNVKKMVYDDHGVQLAAYDQGIPVNGLTGSRRLLNLFIDVGEGHRVLEWEHEDIPRFREMFNSALSLWKLTKKYNPEWHII
jgi:hypothetical protein